MQITEIIGNIGETPTQKIQEETLENGTVKGFITFSVGVYDKSIKNKDGSKTHLTKWYRIIKILYASTVKDLETAIEKYIANNKLSKGNLICIKGKCEDKIDSYNNNVTIKKSIFLTNRSDSGEYLKVIKLATKEEK